jgi:hypothetical protein
MFETIHTGECHIFAARMLHHIPWKLLPLPESFCCLLISEFLAAMAIFTTFRMTADDEAVLPALLKLGVIETSKSAIESPILEQRLISTEESQSFSKSPLPRPAYRPTKLR